MVGRYLTLRSACSGPLWKKPRALRRTKSGSAVSKSHSMSSERQQKSNTPRWARRAALGAGNRDLSFCVFPHETD